MGMQLLAVGDMPNRCARHARNKTKAPERPPRGRFPDAAFEKTEGRDA